MKMIDKAAVEAEIEKLISNGQVKLQESQESKDYESYVAWSEHIATCIKILSLIDTLEVKEVDSDNNPKSLWFDAQGEYLPEYDREVIVLIQDYPDIEEYLRVAYGHRPNPNRYIIKDSEKLHPITFDKGGWNGKNIKWWLDVNFPILQTLEKI